MGPEAAKSFLSVGKLVDMQWKLGVAASSKTCKNLQHTYVSVVLEVSQPDGSSVIKSFEMTLAEFKNFSTQIREMASVLETL